MEQHLEDSESRALRQHEAEMVDVIPMQQKFSCSTICPFSQQEHKVADSRNRSKSTTKLCGLIIFYAAAMVVEIAGGIKANSLAVLTDAGHLLIDIAGICISLLTVWVSGWEVTSEYSYGFHRLEVLGALVSIQLIWAISGTLIYQAVEKFLHKSVEVNGIIMFETAAFGFIINLVLVLWLGHDHSHSHHHHHHHHHHSDTLEEQNHELEELFPESSMVVMPSPSCRQKETSNINVEGAYLHAIVDLIQSAGVMISGAVMWWKPKWFLVDPICTLVFSVVALKATGPMLREIFTILMERTPKDVDITLVKNGLEGIRGVHDVHDLHVWSITVGRSVCSCHVVVEPEVNPIELIHRVREFLQRTFDIRHTNIEIEPFS
ncbi:unnamed protein product [Cuscuta epithymum]|uniref:Uncharacterized protein n=1 Tax=Cuscuta epithymum TaxID=186058 RepID=A0AAV0F0Y6_9ASTE|nr:unnamed protein product [Cuscuta epithymum]